MKVTHLYASSNQNNGFEILDSRLNWDLALRTIRNTKEPVLMRDIGIWEQRIVSALKDRKSVV